MENTAFNDTLCTHRSCLESFAMRFTQDLEDANDLVQDTLIKAIRYHDLYKPGTNMRGWLYTIMKNTFLNDYRRGSRKNAIIQITEEFTPQHLSRSATGNIGENTFMRKDRPHSAGYSLATRLLFCVTLKDINTTKLQMSWVFRSELSKHVFIWPVRN